jgi:hypothetical protein
MNSPLKSERILPTLKPVVLPFSCSFKHPVPRIAGNALSQSPGTRCLEADTKGDLMNIALWITAGLLAVVALTGGVSKTFVPRAKLAATPGGEWTGERGDGFVKTLGVLELLAAAGFVLPAALGVAPVLVPVTAGCWVLLMIGAMATHLRHGEPKFAALNLAYLALAAFLAWGRA